MSSIASATGLGRSASVRRLSREERPAAMISSTISTHARRNREPATEPGGSALAPDEDRLGAGPALDLASRNDAPSAAEVPTSIGPNASRASRRRETRQAPDLRLGL